MLVFCWQIARSGGKMESLFQECTPFIQMRHTQSKWVLYLFLDGSSLSTKYWWIPLNSQVYCNHSVDATYTVIQRRVYGTESFYRDWNAYKYGFGNPLGDYWIGLDSIYHLTSQGKHDGELPEVPYNQKTL